MSDCYRFRGLDGFEWLGCPGESIPQGLKPLFLLPCEVPGLKPGPTSEARLHGSTSIVRKRQIPFDFAQDRLFDFALFDSPTARSGPRLRDDTFWSSILQDGFAKAIRRSLFGTQASAGAAAAKPCCSSRRFPAPIVRVKDDPSNEILDLLCRCICHCRDDLPVPTDCGADPQRGELTFCLEFFD